MNQNFARVGKGFLMFAGSLAVANFFLDVAGTTYIRSHPNVISHLEGSLNQCDRIMAGTNSDDALGNDEAKREAFNDRAYKHGKCLHAEWDRNRDEKNAFLANCKISQVGNFTLSSGDSPSIDTYWDRPLYYSVPATFLFGGECLRYASGKVPLVPGS